MTSFYARRIARVVQYIAEHLEDDLSTEVLSRVAGFSDFHFLRQFRAYTGVSPGRLVRLLRLKHASYRLAVEPHTRVIDIALDAGFEAPESFCRAFRRAQGQSPSAFRREPDWETWSVVFCDALQEATWSQEDVPTIVHFPTTRLAMLEHRGPPAGLMRSVLTFIAWRRSVDLCPLEDSMTLGLMYEPPDSVDDPGFRFGIAASVTAPVPPNDWGVVETTLPGGRCAVVTHRGSTSGLEETVRELYGRWLPHSGEELRNAPCFFHYRARVPEVAEWEQVTDVYLPLI